MKANSPKIPPNNLNEKPMLQKIAFKVNIVNSNPKIMFIIIPPGCENHVIAL